MVRYENTTYVALQSTQGDIPGAGTSKFDWAAIGSPTGSYMYINGSWNDQYITKSLRNGYRWNWGGNVNSVNNTDSGGYTAHALPYKCELFKVTAWFGNLGAETGSTTFTMKTVKNGTDQSSNTMTFASTGSGGNPYVRVWGWEHGAGIPFNAHDTFNIRVTSPTGYTSTKQIGRARIIAVFRVLEW